MDQPVTTDISLALPPRETRRRALTAAQQLFLRRGYAGTTIAAIARHAHISVQSVYNAVGGKPMVLKGVWDITLASDFEPEPMIARPVARAALTAPGSGRCLELYACMSRQIYQRVAPLVPVLLSAAGGDPQVRAVVDTIAAEHAIGTRGMASHVADRFGLRPGLSVDEAADLVWTLTSFEVADGLVRRRQWPLMKYETWLAGAMREALLGPAPERPAAGVGHDLA